MSLENRVSNGIARKFSEFFEDFSRVDVAIVGAGPAGLAAAYRLASRGFKTLVVERMLGVGGGIRGGGMLLPFAAVEPEAMGILREVGVRSDEVDGLYYVSGLEATVKLASAALEKGAFIWPGVAVEDLIVREGPRVEGIVINWEPVVESGWHVDPLMVMARATVDATGHDASLLRLLRKRLKGGAPEVPGMGPMDAEVGERLVVQLSGKVVDGLYAAGMAVAELHGSPRMGPLLGGMLLSGEKVAREIERDLRWGSPYP